MELKNDRSDLVPGYGGENQENDRNMTEDEKAGVEATFEVMGEDRSTVPTPQLSAAGTPVPVNWLKTAAIIFMAVIAASLFFPAVHHLDEPRRIGTDLSDITADDNDDTVTARTEPRQRGESEVPSVGGIRYVESQES